MKQKTFILAAILFAINNTLSFGESVQPINCNEEYSIEVNNIEEYIVVNAPIVNIRSAATASSKIVGKLKEGDVITVKYITGNWARFELDGRDVFVNIKYLKKIEVGVPAQKETPIETLPLSLRITANENISTDSSLQEEKLTKMEQAPHNTDEPNDKSTGIFFNLTTSFHGETPTFGLFAEQSNYNGVHFQTGIRTNFGRSNNISWHLGGGYNLGLYNDNNICVSCVIPVGFDLRMASVPKYDKYESNIYCDFSFSPRLKMSIGKVILSAGYWMTAVKFKFKKEYLGHSAIFSIGYNFW